MNNERVQNELKIKKFWLGNLLVLLFLEITSYVIYQDFLQMSKIGMFLGIVVCCSYKFILYYFGYLKEKTTFLTCVLFLSALGIGIQLFCLLVPCNNSFAQSFSFNLRKMNPILLGCNYLILISFFYFTFKLRKISKIKKLSGLAKP